MLPKKYDIFLQLNLYEENLVSIYLKLRLTN